MINKTLYMVFKNEAGKSFKIKIDNPKEDISKIEIDSLMDEIIQKDVFHTTGGSLKIKENIYIETKQRKTIS